MCERQTHLVRKMLNLYWPRCSDEEHRLALRERLSRNTGGARSALRCGRSSLVGLLGLHGCFQSGKCLLGTRRGQCRQVCKPSWSNLPASEDKCVNH